MADTKISALTAVVTPAGTDELAVNQGGASKKETLTQVRTFVTTPTAPTVVAVTAEFTSTGVPTATLPTGHTTNDILVLVIQSSNEIITAPAGYTQLGPQNGMNTAVTALANRLGIFWKRDGGAESAPTIPDTGDHTYGFMFAIRGCPTVGDPFSFANNNVKFATSLTGTSPKSVTSIDNVLVVDIFAGNVDNASAEGSAGANTDLTSFTEQFDDGTTDGTGGFLWMSSGIKATAGPVKATTVTWANTSSDLCSRIHFIPADAVNVEWAVRGAEIQIFIGSPQDTDDTWVKPTGARRVLVQAVGGGGGGSSGHTVSTAAGGGGGGGGQHTERWFNADDLAATITLHAGKGGAATAVGVDNAGNPGVDSTFNKGGSPVYLTAVAGTGATAAASGDGGNGGSGGGTTVPAAAALQTIAAGELGTSGGNGTTTGVAGSPGEHGGGGGSSGTTAANTTVVGGLSKYGGGGGGAGAVTGTLTAGGVGGGSTAPGTSPSTNGVDSSVLPFGGSGATGGNSTTSPGGSGGFPGGGGGGGGGSNASTQGGRGGHGCIVVTTTF